MRSLITSTSLVISCWALTLASCDYQIPRADPPLEGGGAGGNGVSSSSGNGGSDIASSSSSVASSSSSSSSASSSSSSGTTMANKCGDGVLGPEEKCDDGNDLTGDGCDEKCFIENHDGCGGPILELGNKAVIIASSTAGATDDIMRSAQVEWCAAGSRLGPDLIYSVRATVDGKLVAVLNASYANHFLHIRNACPGMDENEKGCDFDPNMDIDDTSRVDVKMGDVLHVIVDGFGYDIDSGPFTLTLSIQ